MKERMENYKTLPCLLRLRGFSLTSNKSNEKKRFTKLKDRRFNKKAKYIIAAVIIVVFLISVFAFLPNQMPVKQAIYPKQLTLQLIHQLPVLQKARKTQGQV